MFVPYPTTLTVYYEACAIDDQVDWPMKPPIFSFTLSELFLSERVV
jgi:hypothetical protein